MMALAMVEVRILLRSGWFVALLILETVLFGGYWLAAGASVSGAFDRQLAQADALLLLMASLPALLVAALSVASDHEDGMIELWASHRLGIFRYVGGKWLSNSAMLWVINTLAIGISLLLMALSGQASVLPHFMVFLISLVFSLAGSAIFSAWGVFLGMVTRSRMGALVAAIVFWLTSVFVLESMATGLIILLPPIHAQPVLWISTLLNPAETLRIGQVFARGQGSVFGPAFHQVQLFFATPVGIFTGSLILLAQCLAPILVTLGLGKQRFPQ